MCGGSPAAEVIVRCRLSCSSGQTAVMISDEPAPFRVIAVNLPEHARNAIHTDVGAQAAGFPRALVAGVTTYAYLTHPAAKAWGLEWLAWGGGEVRFRSPVFEHDEVECVPVPDGEAVVIEARVGTGAPRAVFRAIRVAGPPPPMRTGEVLPDREMHLVGEWGDEYGERAGEHLDLYHAQAVVHPAVWPALANQVVHAELARGAWIHTRSIVRHHAVAPVGASAVVRSTVVDRSQRHGERAVLDVEISVDAVVVATLEHEAIVALPVGSRSDRRTL